MSSLPSSTVSSRCDEIIARRGLLQHPFYLAWSDGTLPVAALKDYARDYGAFHPHGGRGLGDGRRGAHRRGGGRARIGLGEHVCRRAGDGPVTAEPQVAQVAVLVDETRALFADPADALGALYAFEAQQPFTAQSKLARLREHYAQWPAC